MADSPEDWDLVPDSSFHPLDPIDAVANYSQFYPEFARGHLRNEAIYKVTKIKEYLSSPNKLVRSRGEFMHLVRLLTTLNDDSSARFVSFRDRCHMIESLWILAFEDGLLISDQPRVFDCLSNLLESIAKEHTAPVWANPSAGRYFESRATVIAALSKTIDWRRLYELIQKRYKRDYGDYVDISTLRRKSALQAVVRLCGVARKCVWDGYVVGPQIFNSIIPGVDFKFVDAFLRFRVVLLCTPNSFCHYLVYKQTLFQWWCAVNGASVPSWDSVHLLMLYRAVKYGWARGRPLQAILTPYIPFLMQILLRLLQIPNSCSNVQFHKEAMPGEFTPLLEKQLNPIKSIAKILALIIETPSSDTSKMNKETEFELLTSFKLNEIDKKKNIPTTSCFLKALMAVIFPYTHPSNTGRWSRNLALFMKNFVSHYCHRIHRERAGPEFVLNEVGCCHNEWQSLCKNVYAKYPNDKADDLAVDPKDGFKLALSALEPINETLPDDYIKAMNASFQNTSSYRSLRLGRQADEFIADLIYPISMYGVFARQSGISAVYEDVIKRLCKLVPDKLLEPIIERMIESLGAISESHQTLSSLRVLTQLIPMTIQYKPSYLGQISDLALQGVEPADPMKTIQALTFFNVLFSYLPCIDTSEANISPINIKEFKQIYCNVFRVSNNMKLDINLCKLKKVENDEDAILKGKDFFLHEPLAIKLPSIYNYPKNDINSTEELKNNNIHEWILNNDRQNEIISERQLFTSLLEDFVTNWFENILHLVTHATLPEQENNAASSSIDRGTSIVIRSSCMTILTQTRASSVERVANMFKDWLLLNIIPDACKSVAQIGMGLSSSTNAVNILGIIINPLFEKLLEKRTEDAVIAAKEAARKNNELNLIKNKCRINIDENKDENTYQIRSHLPETHALWYLNALCSLIRRAGIAVLSFKKEVKYIIQACFRHSNKKIFKFGSKFLRRCCESLAAVYIHEKRCIGPKTWSQNKPENMSNHLLMWGNTWWLAKDSTDIQWHIPNEEEISFVKELINIARNIVEIHINNNNTEIKLPWELARHSDGALITRALLLCRGVIKGLSGLYPDERSDEEINSGSIPIINPYKNDLGPECYTWANSIILKITENYLNIIYDDLNQEFKHINTTPLQNNDNMLIDNNNSGVEEAKLMKSLLKLCDQLVVRHWSSLNPRSSNNTNTSGSSGSGSSSQTVTGFSNWLSCYAGAYPNAHWCDLPRSMWLNKVAHSWSNRIDSRRMGHHFENRKYPILLVLYMCTGHYAEVRRLAQSILKDLCTCHYKVRTMIIKKLFYTFVKETGIDPLNPQNETIKNTTESVIFSDLRNCRLTGITYCLNDNQMLKRIWANNELTYKALTVILAGYQAHIDKNTVQARITALTNNFFNVRITENFNDEIEIKMSEILISIIKFLNNGAIGTSWRYSLVGTTICLIFFNKVIIKNQNLLISCIKWFINASDSNKHQPLVNSVAILGLQLTMKAHIDKHIILTSEIIQNLHDPIILRCLFNTIAIIHHENVKGLPQRYPETTQQLIADVLKIDKTWPNTRSPKCSNDVSLHNLIFCQTLFEFLFLTNTSGDLSDLPVFLRTSEKIEENIEKKQENDQQTKENNYSLVYSPFQLASKDLTEVPTSEAELHIGIAEIIGGIIRGSRLWLCHQANEKARKSFWQQILPIIISEYSKADISRSFDWGNCLRFAIHDLNSKNECKHMIPLLNISLMTPLKNSSELYLDICANLSYVEFQNLLNTNTTDIEQSSSISNVSSFEKAKRIRLYECLLAQMYSQEVDFLEISIDSLIDGFSSPYKQIRDEIARAIYFIISIGDDISTKTKESIIIRDKIKKKLKEKSNELLKFISEDQTAASGRTVGSGDSRPWQLCAAETWLCSLLHPLVAHEGTSINDVLINSLPFILSTCNHPENEINSLGNSLLNVFGASSIYSCLSPDKYNDSSSLASRIYIFNKAIDVKLIDILEEYMISPNSSWKIRATIVKLAEAIGTTLPLLLYRSSTYSRLLDLCIKGLHDIQMEVRSSSQKALTSLFMSIDDDDATKYTQQFKIKAGDPKTPPTTPSEIIIVTAAVLGLSAQVQCIPYSVPNWLPDTITTLASYAGPKMPDTIRRIVEKTLQEFFRSHQDAWKQMHEQKFSVEQLDCLDMYKGRPSYFA